MSIEQNPSTKTPHAGSEAVPAELRELPHDETAIISPEHVGEPIGDTMPYTDEERALASQVQAKIASKERTKKSPLMRAGLALGGLAAVGATVFGYQQVSGGNDAPRNETASSSSDNKDAQNAMEDLMDDTGEEKVETPYQTIEELPVRNDMTDENVYFIIEFGNLFEKYPNAYNAIRSFEPERAFGMLGAAKNMSEQIENFNEYQRLAEMGRFMDDENWEDAIADGDSAYDDDSTN